jgi:DNA replication protein DnaC
MKRLSDLINQTGSLPQADGQTSASEGTPSLSAARSDSTPLICFDPEDNSKPCPICGGLGVIKYAVEPSDSRFGKFFRCPNHPLEVDSAHQERMRRLSNLDAFADKSFDNFDLNIGGYSEKEIQSLRMAFNTARNFAEDLQGWLLLEGMYGCGKTHLAAAVGNWRLGKGDMVLFITTPDLLDHLRSSYAPNADSGYDETFNRVRDAGLLILDDLGVENPSEWAKEKLFQLLNHRYSHHKPTVITTNRDLDSLDPRIRSRLLDVNQVHHQIIHAPDYRNAQVNDADQLLSRLPMYSHMNFESFNIEEKVTVEEADRLGNAARVAYQYAQKPENWLLFVGEFGSGKTHLAAAIANYRRNLGEEVVFLTAPDLLDYLRTTFAPESSVSFDKLFDKVRNVPMLVLDDLGGEAAKPWAQEKLFQILDYRYVGRMPTVITSSKDMNELNPRLVSRLIDQRVCRIIEINVQSYALRMKRSKK